MSEHLHRQALSALDSDVSGALHTTDELRSILGERSLIERYLEVETALATAQADIGLIPREAAVAIAKVTVDDLDFTKLADQMAIVGYPVVGLVKHCLLYTSDAADE